MIGKILNGLLLVGIAIGVVRHVRLQTTQALLLEEHRRLVIQYGILPVDDPTKFSIRRVEETEQAHYVWRFYVPENERLVMEYQYPGGSGQNSAGHSPDHGIIRLRIGRREDDVIRIYCSSGGGASSGSLAYPEEFAEFLLDHWDQLQVEIGPDDVLESDLSEPATLLSVSVPDELHAEAIERIPYAESHRIAERLSEPVLVVRVANSTASFEKTPKP